MSTSKEIAQTILGKIEAVANARIRAMMGGYIVYIDDTVAGQINEGELFIKITSFGQGFAPELLSKPPYPGAKPAFVVPLQLLDDQAWLDQFIAGTVSELPKRR